MAITWTYLILEGNVALYTSGNWLDKKKNETTYWKCADFRKGCRGPISTLDDQLTSPTPDHSHDSFFQAKQSLKRKAAQAYLPTKFPCSEAVSGLGFEARAKLAVHSTLLEGWLDRASIKATDTPPTPKP
ncbi:hypothetical protein ACHWQZ_G013723 [Mnemiopsis leidyi]